jgi:hypothetical protein
MQSPVGGMVVSSADAALRPPGRIIARFAHEDASSSADWADRELAQISRRRGYSLRTVQLRPVAVLQPDELGFFL